VHQLAPYNDRGARDTRNAADSIYNTPDCMTAAAVSPETNLNLISDATHAVGSFNVLLDLSANATTCSPAGGGADGPGSPRGPRGGLVFAPGPAKMWTRPA
jgi:hypothetical protein